MCTSRKPDSSAMAEKQTPKYALCILEGVQLPLRVEVISEEMVSTVDHTLNTRKVLLNKDDVRIVWEEYKKLLSMFGWEELVVPDHSLVHSVSGVPDTTKPRKALFGVYYYPVNVDGINDTDIVAWVPPLAFGKTELIPCTLYFMGQETPTSNSWAFVCPLRHFSESSLTYTWPQPSTKVKGWGQLFKVPPTDIYRWEDISEKRRQLADELRFEKLESRDPTSSRPKLYEFCYSRVKSTQDNDKRADKGLYPNLEKSLPDVHGSSENSSKSPRSSLSREPGKHVTRITLDNDTARGMHESFEQDGKTYTRKRSTEKLDETSRDPLLNRKGWETTKTLPDDRSEIPGGSVAKGKQQFSNDDSLNKSNSFTTVTRKGRRTLPSQEDQEMIHKTVLFGKCFVDENKIEKVFINEVQSGDMVVATPLGDHDDIVGNVGLICEIPALKPKQIFVGVQFEEKINIEPFEIRHAWGEGCDRCGDGNYVVIPIEFLLSPDSDNSEKSFRLLKDTLKEKSAAKETITTSDIHVDFQYEASRRDFVELPLQCHKISSEKLANTGIQGNANSCYIDAVVFALYAFTNSFDVGLQGAAKKRDVDELSITIDAARNLLKYDIVTPLRCSLKVNWVNVFKMRKALAEIMGDKSYLGNFMDTETFIVSLFSTVLHVPEFYEIGDDNKDYVLQLFPPMSEDGENKVEKPSVQYLLEEYCTWADIKLRDVPQPGFLIKLPVSNGVPQFKMVYPNLELQLDEIIEKKHGTNKSMVLRSVICLKKNHFTCFVRAPINKRGQETKWTWLFHDSMAAEIGQQTLTVCEGLEEAIGIVSPFFRNPSETYDKPALTSLGQDCKTWLDLMLTTAYICVYEPSFQLTNI